MTIPKVNHPWREPALKGRDTRQGHRTEYPADFPVTSRLKNKTVSVPVRQSVRAADLLALERCSAPCLLAAEDGECACRCSGEFHGALTDADVTIDPGTECGKAILRATRREEVPSDAVPRGDIRALPFDAPRSVLRLRLAMLAWDCGAKEAAKRIGMDRRSMYRAMGPWIAQDLHFPAG
jgi:hypothetical protein